MATTEDLKKAGGELKDRRSNVTSSVSNTAKKAVEPVQQQPQLQTMLPAPSSVQMTIPVQSQNKVTEPLVQLPVPQRESFAEQADKIETGPLTTSSTPLAGFGRSLQETAKKVFPGLYETKEERGRSPFVQTVQESAELPTKEILTKAFGKPKVAAKYIWDGMKDLFAGAAEGTTNFIGSFDIDRKRKDDVYKNNVDLISRILGPTYQQKEIQDKIISGEAGDLLDRALGKGFERAIDFATSQIGELGGYDKQLSIQDQRTIIDGFNKRLKDSPTVSANWSQDVGYEDIVKLASSKYSADKSAETENKTMKLANERIYDKVRSESSLKEKAIETAIRSEEDEKSNQELKKYMGDLKPTPEQAAFIGDKIRETDLMPTFVTGPIISSQYLKKTMRDNMSPEEKKIAEDMQKTGESNRDFLLKARVALAKQRFREQGKTPGQALDEYAQTQGYKDFRSAVGSDITQIDDLSKLIKSGGEEIVGGMYGLKDFEANKDDRKYSPYEMSNWFRGMMQNKYVPKQELGGMAGDIFSALGQGVQHSRGRLYLINNYTTEGYKNLMDIAKPGTRLEHIFGIKDLSSPSSSVDALGMSSINEVANRIDNDDVPIMQHVGNVIQDYIGVAAETYAGLKGLKYTPEFQTEKTAAQIAKGADALSELNKMKFAAKLLGGAKNPEAAKLALKELADTANGGSLRIKKIANLALNTANDYGISMAFQNHIAAPYQKFDAAIDGSFAIAEILATISRGVVGKGLSVVETAKAVMEGATKNALQFSAKEWAQQPEEVKDFLVNGFMNKIVERTDELLKATDPQVVRELTQSRTDTVKAGFLPKTKKAARIKELGDSATYQQRKELGIKGVVEEKHFPVLKQILGDDRAEKFADIYEKSDIPLYDIIKSNPEIYEKYKAIDELNVYHDRDKSIPVDNETKARIILNAMQSDASIPDITKEVQSIMDRRAKGGSYEQYKQIRDVLENNGRTPEEIQQTLAVAEPGEELSPEIIKMTSNVFSPAMKDALRKTEIENFTSKATKKVKRGVTILDKEAFDELDKLLPGITPEEAYSAKTKMKKRGGKTYDESDYSMYFDRKKIEEEAKVQKDLENINTKIQEVSNKLEADPNDIEARQEMQETSVDLERAEKRKSSLKKTDIDIQAREELNDYREKVKNNPSSNYSRHNTTKSKSRDIDGRYYKEEGALSLPRGKVFDGTLESLDNIRPTKKIVNGVQVPQKISVNKAGKTVQMEYILGQFDAKSSGKYSGNIKNEAKMPRQYVYIYDPSKTKVSVGQNGISRVTDLKTNKSWSLSERMGTSDLDHGFKTIKVGDEVDGVLYPELYKQETANAVNYDKKIIDDGDGHGMLRDKKTGERTGLWSVAMMAPTKEYPYRRYNWGEFPMDMRKSDDVVEMTVGPTAVKIDVSKEDLPFIRKGNATEWKPISRRWNGKDARFGYERSSERNITVAESEEVVRKYMGVQDVGLRYVDEIIVGGKSRPEASGVAYRGDIQLLKKISFGTAEHEVIHAFIRRHIDDARKNKIIDDVIKEYRISEREAAAYGETIDKYAEEAVADLFYDRLKERDTVFGKVKQRFKSIFGNETEAQKLYRDIIDRKKFYNGVREKKFPTKPVFSKKTIEPDLQIAYRVGDGNVYDGMHMGTFKAASDRSQIMKGAISKFIVDTARFLKIQDTGSDLIPSVIKELQGKVDDDILQTAIRRYNSEVGKWDAVLSNMIGRVPPEIIDGIKNNRKEANRAIFNDMGKEIKDRHGFEGLRYENQVEDIGSESFVIFDKNDATPFTQQEAIDRGIDINKFDISEDVAKANGYVKRGDMYIPIDTVHVEDVQKNIDVLFTDVCYLG